MNKSLFLINLSRFGSILLLTVAPKLWAAELSGTIKVDGSSTVFPITEAVSEEFQKAHPKVRVTVGMSGTGGGLKKFSVGEIDIADASRPVTAPEAKKAAENKIELIELPVAYDGLSVVVNPKNEFVKSMTFDQLKKLWEPGSKVKTWKDLNPSWPDQAIKLYGPGADSGTFEFFTEVIMGKARASRSDYTSSEDDNVLVNGVAGDANAIGYFGYSYYISNVKKLKAVAIDHGKGAVLPSDETVTNHTYPLARPLFIVVNKAAANRPEVDAYVNFYLAQSTALAKAVGYVGLPKETSEAALSIYKNRTVGNWKGVKH